MEAASGSELRRELVLVLVLAIVIVLDTLGNSANNLADMAFDHEKLDVSRLAVRFSSWVGERLEGSLTNSRTSATKHLDEASGPITNNIAEGNGKRSRTDRCRFLDIARGSALECAACLDYAGRAKAD